MKISEIYEMMTLEKLTYSQVLSLMESRMTVQGLYYHVKKYCKEFALPMPASKRGRKAIVKHFKLKGE